MIHKAHNYSRNALWDNSDGNFDTLGFKELHKSSEA